MTPKPEDNRLHGLHPVAECLRAGRRQILSLSVSGASRIRDLEAVLGVPLPLRAEVEDRGTLSRRAGTQGHQGILAEASPYPYEDWRDLLEEQRPFLLLLDNLEDPQNVGAILRTAYCAGVTGVCLRKHHAVGVTAAVAKASAGAVEHLRIARVPNLSLVLGACGERDIVRIALESGGESLWKADVDWEGALAVVVGSEGKGVSPLVGKNCDRRLAIPMRGRLDSLNASVAAALVLFEAARRRNS